MKLSATEMASLEMLRTGFTMFIEPGSLFSTEAGAEAVGRVGIRALFAPLYLWDRQECFDAVPSLMSPSLAARAAIDHGRAMGLIGSELRRNKDPEALVRGFVFVYGAGTASPELLQAAHATAQRQRRCVSATRGIRAGGGAHISGNQWQESHRALDGAGGAGR